MAALECEVAQLQDQLDSSLRWQAQLWQEMKQLQEHFEVRKADLSQNTIIHFLRCFP